MRRLNIRWRLTLWFGAAMTALLLVRSFWIYFMLERRLAKATAVELNLALDVLEDRIGAAADRAELNRALEQYSATHRNLQIEAVAPGGILFRSPTEADLQIPLPAAPAPKKSDRRRITQSSYEGGWRGGVTESIASPIGPLTVKIERSTQAEKNEAWDFALTLLTTGPMVIAGALGAGYLVSSRALTPVDNMISAAKHITARRLHQRINVPDTGDELARLAQTLNEMIDRLQSSFEEMRRFTADAAHDLRTPVAALRTEVEVSLMADKTVEDYRGSMQTVLDEVVALSHLTGQLLDLSREDHGMHPNQDEPVRLDSLVQGVVADLQTAARQKEITVTARQLPPWTVSGNQVRLRRVLMNLLDNAIQYTPIGGQIWFGAEFSAGEATLVVADNGPGIPAEELPFIFDRFRRVDKARNRQMGGTGLGLAICKSIVEAHGGRIAMESDIGRGTRVRVTLPNATSTPESPPGS